QREAVKFFMIQSLSSLWPFVRSWCLCGENASSLRLHLHWGRRDGHLLCGGLAVGADQLELVRARGEREARREAALVAAAVAAGHRAARDALALRVLHHHLPAVESRGAVERDRDGRLRPAGRFHAEEDARLLSLVVE